MLTIRPECLTLEGLTVRDQLSQDLQGILNGYANDVQGALGENGQQYIDDALRNILQCAGQNSDLHNFEYRILVYAHSFGFREFDDVYDKYSEIVTDQSLSREMQNQGIRNLYPAIQAVLEAMPAETRRNLLHVYWDKLRRKVEKNISDRFRIFLIGIMEANATQRKKDEVIQGDPQRGQFREYADRGFRPLPIDNIAADVTQIEKEKKS